MFGNGYTPMESKAQIPAGVYDAKITRVEEKNGSNGDFRNVYVEVKGYAGGFPERSTMFDFPVNGEQWQKDLWNKNTTRFFDNFNIPRGDFNIGNWVNHYGKVTVRPQAKDSPYMEIVLWEAPIEKKGTKAADKPAETNVTVSSIPAEDIPF